MQHTNLIHQKHRIKWQNYNCYYC